MRADEDIRARNRLRVFCADIVELLRVWTNNGNATDQMEVFFLHVFFCLFEIDLILKKKIIKYTL